MSELGETLKNTRKEKGISLEELQASTKIQKRYLEAVEKGEYGQLPGRFYARAFIKSYAEAVGLDPDELFDTYAGEVPVTGDSVPEQLPSRSRRDRAQTSRPRVSAPSKGKTSASSILPKVLAAVAIVGLFAVIWFAVQESGQGPGAGSDPQDTATGVEFSENPDVDTKPADNGEEKQSSEPSGKKGGNNQNKEEPAQQPEKPEQVLTKTGKEGSVFHYTLKNADQFKLKLSIDGDSWIEIRKSGASGEKYVYAMKHRGATVTKNLSNNEQVFLKIGSTPHVKMYINGEPFVYPNDEIYQKFLITFQKSENAS